MSRRRDRSVGPVGQVVLGGVFFVLGLLLAAMLVELWPTIERGTAEGAAQLRETKVSLLWGILEVDVTPDTALILLVIVASALGSYVHVATSFADYVGNRRLAWNWIWWYVLRLTIGVALALVFYFAVRGGLFAADATTAEVNPFGVAALAGLVGMFSKQATDKLEEVFTALFRTERRDAERADGITNPVPYVAGIEPPVLPAGSETATVEIVGEGFVEDSTVRLSRVTEAGTTVVQRKSEFASPTEIRITLLTEDLLEAGYLDVEVVNPEPGGGASEPVRIDVSPPMPAEDSGAEEEEAPE